MGEWVTDNEAIDINKNIIVNQNEVDTTAQKTARKVEIMVVLDEMQANKEVIMSRFQTTVTDKKETAVTMTESHRSRECMQGC